MKTKEIMQKLEEYILSFKGIHIEETAGGKVFYLVSKPFAAIFSETIEIKAKNDYNETIRFLHDEINEAKIMGEGWNEIRYSEKLPFEVILVSLETPETLLSILRLRSSSRMRLYS